MARIKINKSQAELMLKYVDGGVWRPSDAFKMGPINLRNGFRLIAKKIGATFQYFCVACKEEQSHFGYSITTIEYKGS